MLSCGGGGRVVSSAVELQTHSFDRISCLEVCEHLPPERLSEALDQMRRLLKPQGLLMISVPIETGPAGLVKNLIRFLLRQEHQKTSLGLLCRVLWGLKIERQQNVDYISSHVGFNHHDLKATCQEHGWLVEKVSYSPFPILRSFGNSQVFFQLRAL